MQFAAELDGFDFWRSVSINLYDFADHYHCHLWSDDGIICCSVPRPAGLPAGIIDREEIVQGPILDQIFTGVDYGNRSTIRFMDSDGPRRVARLERTFWISCGWVLVCDWRSFNSRVDHFLPGFGCVGVSDSAKRQAAVLLLEVDIGVFGLAGRIRCDLEICHRCDDVGIRKVTHYRPKLLRQ